jgi:hypothetical protein
VWDRFTGIDFSGSRDAGRKIWIAEAEGSATGLRVLSLERADRKLGVSSEREHVLPALVEFIAGQRGALIGMDFPFSLPECALFARPWRDLALQLGERFTNPDEMRDWCWRQTGNREQRRETERVAVTPFCSYNLWIKCQTYYGISRVIAPLVRTGAGQFPPMQPVAVQSALPTVIEVCPASTLKSLRTSSGGYKGRSAAHRERRVEILGALKQFRLLGDLSSELEQTTLSNSDGDALDAIIAAIAASRAVSQLESPASAALACIDEGCVYF